MAALAADAYMEALVGFCSTQFVANATDIYYRGAIVFNDTGGGAQVTAAAGDQALGISPKYQSVTAGDLVEVIIGGFVWLPVGTNVSAADEGKLAKLPAAGLTDNPGDAVSQGDVAMAANDIVIGRIMRVTTSRMLINLAYCGWLGTGVDTII